MGRNAALEIIRARIGPLIKNGVGDDVVTYDETIILVRQRHPRSCEFRTVVGMAMSFSDMTTQAGLPPCNMTALVLGQGREWRSEDTVGRKRSSLRMWSKKLKYLT
jgi:hypothetical protein